MSISITEFNRDINNSGNLISKFESWSKYRENIKKFSIWKYRKSQRIKGVLMKKDSFFIINLFKFNVLEKIII